MLSIIKERLKTYLEWQISREQAGFVWGCGTREQILDYRQIIKIEPTNLSIYVLLTIARFLIALY